MICVIHEPGTSFKGLWAYLGHDKGAETSERVAWTHTCNLSTDSPELGWRIMASTAMMQPELKRKAGIQAGRKSKSTVMHYTLSWHAEERDELSKEAMLEAALQSLTYIGTREGEKLGRKKKPKKGEPKTKEHTEYVYAKRTQYADEHQAIIVCHDEGPGSEPHVHVMLCRPHPVHGVNLPDSKDYEKLSAWALEYRQAMNKAHYCPERVKNAAIRAQGLLTSHRRKPRNIYQQEQELAAAPENSQQQAALLELRERLRQLQQRTDQQRLRHAEQTRKLEDEFLGEEQRLRTEAKHEIRTKRAALFENYAQNIRDRVAQQMDEMAAFERSQQTMHGHARNAWEAFKNKAWMQELQRGPLNTLRKVFGLAFSAGMQKAELEKKHARELRRIRGQRTQEARAVARPIRERVNNAIEALRGTYSLARDELFLTQAMDKAKLKADWREYDKQRRAVRAQWRHSQAAKADPRQKPATPPVKDAFTRAAESALQKEVSDGEDEKQRKIDAKREKMRKARENSQKRGKRPRR